MTERQPGRPRAATQEMEELRRRDEYKTQILNAVAHELSTPLTPIRLQMHLLMARLPPQLGPDEQRGLEIVRRNIDRLQSLVKDILDMARLESSRLPVALEATDLGSVVREAVGTFRDTAAAAGLSIEAAVDDGMRVLADARRLIQVLHNLLSNAIKFTPEGGWIDVQAHRVADEVIVTVQDSGSGFPPEDAARLFRPFSQLDIPTSMAFRGSGLGLYISLGIIELHGGHIWARSPGPGKGATFGFAIPIMASGAVVSARIPMPTRVLDDRAQSFAERVRSLI